MSQPHPIGRGLGLVPTEEEKLSAFVALLEERQILATPPPKRYRHQMLHFDFWLIFASGACIFLVFTSFIPRNVFEPLLAFAFLFNVLAQVTNLTREREELERKTQVQKAEPRSNVVGGFWKTWQVKAGIKPLD